eukprot:tig00000882_g5275.t1
MRPARARGPRQCSEDREPFQLADACAVHFAVHHASASATEGHTGAKIRSGLPSDVEALRLAEECGAEQRCCSAHHPPRRRLVRPGALARLAIISALLALLGLAPACLAQNIPALPPIYAVAIAQNETYAYLRLPTPMELDFSSAGAGAMLEAWIKFDAPPDAGREFVLFDLVAAVADPLADPPVPPSRVRVAVDDRALLHAHVTGADGATVSVSPTATLAAPAKNLSSGDWHHVMLTLTAAGSGGGPSHATLFLESEAYSEATPVGLDTAAAVSFARAHFGRSAESIDAGGVHNQTFLVATLRVWGRIPEECSMPEIPRLVFQSPVDGLLVQVALEEIELTDTIPTVGSLGSPTFRYAGLEESSLAQITSNSTLELFPCRYPYEFSVSHPNSIGQLDGVMGYLSDRDAVLQLEPVTMNATTLYTYVNVGITFNVSFQYTGGPDPDVLREEVQKKDQNGIPMIDPDTLQPIIEIKETVIRTQSTVVSPPSCPLTTRLDFTLPNIPAGLAYIVSSTPVGLFGGGRVTITAPEPPKYLVASTVGEGVNQPIYLMGPAAVFKITAYDKNGINREYPSVLVKELNAVVMDPEGNYSCSISPPSSISSVGSEWELPMFCEKPATGPGLLWTDPPLYGDGFWSFYIRFQPKFIEIVLSDNAFFDEASERWALTVGETYTMTFFPINFAKTVWCLGDDVRIRAEGPLSPLPALYGPVETLGMSTSFTFEVTPNKTGRGLIAGRGRQKIDGGVFLYNVFGAPSAMKLTFQETGESTIVTQAGATLTLRVASVDSATLAPILIFVNAEEMRITATDFLTNTTFEYPELYGTDWAITFTVPAFAFGAAKIESAYPPSLGAATVFVTAKLTSVVVTLPPGLLRGNETGIYAYTVNTTITVTVTPKNFGNAVYVPATIFDLRASGALTTADLDTPVATPDVRGFGSQFVMKVKIGLRTGTASITSRPPLELPVSFTVVDSPDQVRLVLPEGVGKDSAYRVNSTFAVTARPRKAGSAIFMTSTGLTLSASGVLKNSSIHPIPLGVDAMFAVNVSTPATGGLAALHARGGNVSFAIVEMPTELTFSISSPAFRTPEFPIFVYSRTPAINCTVVPRIAGRTVITHYTDVRLSSSGAVPTAALPPLVGGNFGVTTSFSFVIPFSGTTGPVNITGTPAFNPPLVFAIADVPTGMLVDASKPEYMGPVYMANTTIALTATAVRRSDRIFALNETIKLASLGVRTRFSPLSPVYSNAFELTATLSNDTGPAAFEGTPGLMQPFTFWVVGPPTIAELTCPPVMISADSGPIECTLRSLVGLNHTTWTHHSWIDAAISNSAASASVASPQYPYVATSFSVFVQASQEAAATGSESTRAFGTVSAAFTMPDGVVVQSPSVNISMAFVPDRTSSVTCFPLYFDPSTVTNCTFVARRKSVAVHTSLTLVPSTIGPLSIVWVENATSFGSPSFRFSARATNLGGPARAVVSSRTADGRSFFLADFAVTSADYPSAVQVDMMTPVSAGPVYNYNSTITMTVTPLKNGTRIYALNSSIIFTTALLRGTFGRLAAPVANGWILTFSLSEDTGPGRLEFTPAATQPVLYWAIGVPDGANLTCPNVTTAQGRKFNCTITALRGGAPVTVLPNAIRGVVANSLASADAAIAPWPHASTTFSLPFLVASQPARVLPANTTVRAYGTAAATITGAGGALIPVAPVNVSVAFEPDRTSSVSCFPLYFDKSASPLCTFIARRSNIVVHSSLVLSPGTAGPLAVLSYDPAAVAYGSWTFDFVVVPLPLGGQARAVVYSNRTADGAQTFLADFALTAADEPTDVRVEFQNPLAPGPVFNATSTIQMTVTPLKNGTRIYALNSSISFTTLLRGEFGKLTAPVGNSWVLTFTLSDETGPGRLDFTPPATQPVIYWAIGVPDAADLQCPGEPTAENSKFNCTITALRAGQPVSVLPSFIRGIASNSLASADAAIAPWPHASPTFSLPFLVASRPSPTGDPLLRAYGTAAATIAGTGGVPIPVAPVNVSVAFEPDRTSSVSCFPLYFDSSATTRCTFVPRRNGIVVQTSVPLVPSTAGPMAVDWVDGSATGFGSDLLEFTAAVLPIGGPSNATVSAIAWANKTLPCDTSLWAGLVRRSLLQSPTNASAENCTSANATEPCLDPGATPSPSPSPSPTPTPVPLCPALVQVNKSLAEFGVITADEPTAVQVDYLSPKFSGPVYVAETAIAVFVTPLVENGTVIYALNTSVSFATVGLNATFGTLAAPAANGWLLDLWLPESTGPSALEFQPPSVAPLPYYVIGNADGGQIRCPAGPFYVNATFNCSFEATRNGSDVHLHVTSVRPSVAESLASALTPLATSAWPHVSTAFDVTMTVAAEPRAPRDSSRPAYGIVGGSLAASDARGRPVPLVPVDVELVFDADTTSQLACSPAGVFDATSTANCTFVARRRGIPVRSVFPLSLNVSGAIATDAPAEYNASTWTFSFVLSPLTIYGGVGHLAVYSYPSPPAPPPAAAAAAAPSAAAANSTGANGTTPSPSPSPSPTPTPLPIVRPPPILLANITIIVAAIPDASSSFECATNLTWVGSPVLCDFTPRLEGESVYARHGYLNVDWPYMRPDHLAAMYGVNYATTFTRVSIAAGTLADSAPVNCTGLCTFTLTAPGRGAIAALDFMVVGRPSKAVSTIACPVNELAGNQSAACTFRSVSLVQGEPVVTDLHALRVLATPVMLGTAWLEPLPPARDTGEWDGRYSDTFTLWVTAGTNVAGTLNVAVHPLANRGAGSPLPAAASVSFFIIGTNIASVQPQAANVRGGIAVSVSGLGFVLPPEPLVLTFCGVEARVTSRSTTTLIAILPPLPAEYMEAGRRSCDVVVTLTQRPAAAPVVLKDGYTYNVPPVAAAERLESFYPLPREIVLNGSASVDPDASAGARNRGLRFKWAVVERPDPDGEVVLFGSSEEVALVGPLQVAGFYAFELTVTDAGGETSTVGMNFTAEFLPELDLVIRLETEFDPFKEQYDNDEAFRDSIWMATAEEFGVAVSRIQGIGLAQGSVLLSTTISADNLVDAASLVALPRTYTGVAYNRVLGGGVSSSVISSRTRQRTVNQAPVANITVRCRSSPLPDGSYSVRASACTLDGNGSFDPDGYVGIFTWSLIQTPESNCPVFRGTKNWVDGRSKGTLLMIFGEQQGVCVVALSVLDNNNLRSARQANVTLRMEGVLVNSPPEFEYDAQVTVTVSLEDGAYDNSTTVELTAIAADPDGLLASAAWSYLDGPINATLRPLLAVNASAGAEPVQRTPVTSRARVVGLGTWRFEVAATDDLGLTTRNVTALTVRLGPPPPVTDSIDPEVARRVAISLAALSLFFIVVNIVGNAVESCMQTWAGAVPTRVVKTAATAGSVFAIAQFQMLAALGLLTNQDMPASFHAFCDGIYPYLLQGRSPDGLTVPTNVRAPMVQARRSLLYARERDVVAGFKSALLYSGIAMGFVSLVHVAASWFFRRACGRKTRLRGALAAPRPELLVFLAAFRPLAIAAAAVVRFESGGWRVFAGAYLAVAGVLAFVVLQAVLVFFLWHVGAVVFDVNPHRAMLRFSKPPPAKPGAGDDAGAEKKKKKGEGEKTLAASPPEPARAPPPQPPPPSSLIERMFQFSQTTRKKVVKGRWIVDRHLGERAHWFADGFAPIFSPFKESRSGFRSYELFRAAAWAAILAVFARNAGTAQTEGFNIAKGQAFAEVFFLTTIELLEIGVQLFFQPQISWWGTALGLHCSLCFVGIFAALACAILRLGWPFDVGRALFLLALAALLPVLLDQAIDAAAVLLSIASKVRRRVERRRQGRMGVIAPNSPLAKGPDGAPAAAHADESDDATTEESEDEAAGGGPAWIAARRYAPSLAPAAPALAPALALAGAGGPQPSLSLLSDFLTRQDGGARAPGARRGSTHSQASDTGSGASWIAAGGAWHRVGEPPAAAAAAAGRLVRGAPARAVPIAGALALSNSGVANLPASVLVAAFGAPARPAAPARAPARRAPSTREGPRPAPAGPPARARARGDLGPGAAAGLAGGELGRERGAARAASLVSLPAAPAPLFDASLLGAFDDPPPPAPAAAAAASGAAGAPRARSRPAPGRPRAAPPAAAAAAASEEDHDYDFNERLEALLGAASDPPAQAPAAPPPPRSTSSASHASRSSGSRPGTRPPTPWPRRRPPLGPPPALAPARARSPAQVARRDPPPRAAPLAAEEDPEAAAEHKRLADLFLGGPPE